MQLLLFFSSGHWSQQHFNSLMSVAVVAMSKLLRASQAAGAGAQDHPPLPSSMATVSLCSICMGTKKDPKLCSLCFTPVDQGDVGVSEAERGAGGSSHSRSLPHQHSETPEAWPSAGASCPKLLTTTSINYCRKGPCREGAARNSSFRAIGLPEISQAWHSPAWQSPAWHSPAWQPFSLPSRLARPSLRLQRIPAQQHSGAAGSAVPGLTGELHIPTPQKSSVPPLLPSKLTAFQWQTLGKA